MEIASLVSPQSSAQKCLKREKEMTD